MSIAVTAPQKFDFQDIVCVEMMLRFAHWSEARFFVEPKDGEDGELHFTSIPSGRCAEIQVKGASGAVTLATLATCLAHTPARSVANTLLERLYSDPERLVVLAMSGRCDDASAIYTVRADWDGSPHPADHVSIAETAALLKAFAAADIPGTSMSRLRAKREAHNASIAANVDKAAVRAALNRLVILECLDEANLEASCARYLRRECRIPGDRVSDVLSRLRASVKSAKDENIDAFPLIRAVLRAVSPPPVCPVDYIDRGDEADRFNELSRTGVLLLSGTPRVGKTWAARRTASALEPYGYEILTLNDVDQTERYLLEPTDALRAIILDDPLGGTHAVTEATRALARIDALIPRLPLNRKLIVSQSGEQLLATARVESLSMVSTAGHRWHDLGHFPAIFLSGVWRQLATQYCVTDDLRQLISDALLYGSLSLEPGCLQHLAINHQRCREPLSLAEVVRLAREDAAGMGHMLVEAGHELLLSALAVTTTANEPISFTELAFAIGAGGDGLPSHRKRKTAADDMEASSYSDLRIPVYDEPPRLTAEQEIALDDLERRRFIIVDDRPSVQFMHPFYRAAAEAVLKGQTYRGAKRTTIAVQRGLFCLSPATSRATAQNLDLVYDQLTSRPDIQLHLAEHAIDGLSSYFLATRDLCFRFLMRHFVDLPIEQKKDLPNWVRRVTSANLYNIEWHSGHAHLPVSYFSVAKSWDRFLTRVVRDEVETELGLLNDPEGGYVTPERAAKTLKFLAIASKELSTCAIGRLLSYDEAALRADAIRLWLRDPRSEDETVLLRVFADDHPSCALAALEGAIAGWHNYTVQRQQRVLHGLSTLAMTVSCAATMLDHLVKFDREEVTGENPPWPIFAALLPVAMQATPHNEDINDARLFTVIEGAVRILPADSIAAICNAWIDWLERNADAGIIPPSEYSFGVGTILVSATRNEPILRGDQIKRLLAFPGTGALVVFVGDLVDVWDDLMEDERTTLVDRLVAGRSDDIWLQGVALTRSFVPAALQQALLGSEVALNDGAAVILSKVAPDLVDAAVHVYIGRPQPLWWLGKHHSGNAVWEAVVQQIAQSPTHPLFELAWEDVAYLGNGPLVTDIVDAVGAAHADRMLNILIRIKVGCVGNYMPEAWAKLLSLAPDEQVHSGWIDRMAEYAPAILDDVSDIRLWLSEDRDQQAMFNNLLADAHLIRAAMAFSDAWDDAETDRSVAVSLRSIELMLERSPPRLFGTCDRVLELLQQRATEAQALKTALGQRRDAILDERDRLEESLETPDSPLFGWIYP